MAYSFNKVSLMRKTRGTQQLGIGNSRAECPINDARDVQFIVHENILSTKIMVAERKAIFLPIQTGDDPISNENSNEAVVVTILARFCFAAGRNIVVPALLCNVVFGKVGVFLRARNWREKNMVSHV